MAIEPFDHQHTIVFEIGEGDIGARDTKGCGHFEAEKFVFDTRCQIQTIGQAPDPRLQDVSGCRGAAGFVPAILPVQKGGLFLGAGDGNSEIYIFAQSQGRNGKFLYETGDFPIIDGNAIHRASGAGGLAIGKELECPHTVAADRSEQVVSIGSLCPNAFGGPTTNEGAIGEQIFQNRVDCRAAIPVLAKRQRERDGKGAIPLKPGGIVLEIDGATRRSIKPTNEAAVQENRERRLLVRTRH
ncbi:hypothetical protein F11_12550 [Rhodospirillum rubrum F11]|nr:hypothetical protein F11_12550 [Rhodospirillum rubrum F11]